jgi:hypothetical protein
MALIRARSSALEKRPIADAIKKRYPQLNQQQAERFAEEMIKQIVVAIQSGKNLAFVELVDGDIQIDVISVIDQVVGNAISR